MRGSLIAGVLLISVSVSSAPAQVGTPASAEWEIHLQRAVDLWDQDQLHPALESRQPIIYWYEIENTLMTGELPQNMGPHLAILNHNQPALREFWMALQSGAQPVALKSDPDHLVLDDDTVRNFEERSLTAFLLFESLVSAHAADGRPSLDRAVPALQFTLGVQESQTNLLCHLIHLHRLRIPLMGVGQILGLGGFTPQELDELNGVLSAVSDPHFGRSEALAGHADCYTSRETRAWLETKASREAFVTRRTVIPDGDLPVLGARMEELLELSAAHLDRLSQLAQRPSWETELWRRDIRAEFTDDPIVRPEANPLEFFTRSICVESIFALVQQQVDLLTDSGEVRLDPFTGEPLRMDGEHLWSLGPDTEDQDAQLVYDPTNGTLSAGDIIVPRPHDARN